MENDRPRKDQIFNIAAEIADPELRAAYLGEACGHDTSLREQIERLLQHDQEDASFLESPPPGVEATDIRPLTEQPGDVIGPYKLLQQIGEGGMGTVFMAEQTKPVERRVALKIIKPGMDTRHVIARFEAERQALAMMDHPNIAKVLDAGTTETGRPYFVMELVKGMPVTQYCDEQHLTPKERLELFLLICQAVQHAHQKGIIHRDLKPTNILVAQYDNKAVPKIIDFGVAKAISQKLTEKTMFTQYGQIVGTVDYMSPEQAQLNQLDVDTRSDVYSLGVLLYELLTGETPFDKERLRSAAFDELLRIIREEEPPKPSTKLSSSESLANTAINRKMEPKKLSLLVRGDLDWIVMKALEKDRNRRYETPSQFAEDVQHYLNDEPVTACPPSTAYKFRKFARRNKTVIGTTATIVLTMIAGITGTTWQALRATAEAERASKEASRADEQADKAKTEAAIALAVNEFLNADLLGMGDAAAQSEAELSPNPNIKLRTILDRAARKIDGRFPDQPLVEAAIRETIGKTYRSIGAYEEAEKHHRRALELRQKESGLEHPHTLGSANNLANVYRSEGRYAEAEQLHRQTLRVLRRMFGEQHPQTLDSMNNLATVYDDQGRYHDAEELYLQRLEIQKRTLGNEHPATLLSISNLSHVYVHQARYDQAEALIAESLAGRRRLLGNEHPHTLLSMNNLAYVYYKLGRYREAEELFQKTLKIYRRTEGDEHPETLRCSYNLANVLRAEGRYEESERQHRETLEIRRRILGDEHPQTLTSMNDLANVYLDLHQYVVAEELYRQTWEIRQQTLGNEHPDTLGSMGNLANVFNAQGRFDEAERMHRRILEIQRRVLGAEHPDTLASMNNLANVFEKQGRYSDAERLHRETLELRRQVFGKEHPLTLMSMCNLANAYSVQERYDDADQMYEQTLEIQRRTLGADHPSTLSTLHNLAINRESKKDWESAINAYREVLAIAPNRVDALRGLGYSLEQIDDQQAAASAYRKAVLLGNKDAWTWEALARVTRSTGGAESVLHTFSELIEEGGPNPHALQYRSWAYREMGRIPEAIEDLLEVIELDPVRADPHRQLAEVRYHQQHWGEAAKSMEKAIEFGLPVDARTALQLAISYGHLGKREKAAEWYAQAIALMEEQELDDSLVQMRGQAEKLLGIATPRTAKN